MTTSDQNDISEQQKLEFRKEEIGYILSKVKGGDSCSVVGVGSVGKSNLLRHLRKPRTQAYHLGEAAQNLTMILVDPNNMLESLPLQSHSMPDENADQRSAWAGYEIMAHRLYKAFYPFDGFSPNDAKEFTYAYRTLRDGSNPLLSHIGLRYLEHVLELLFMPTPDGIKRNITFIFDEFEDMLHNLPVRFFQTLRGLRDDYKYRLTYITFTRRSLPQILQENNYDRLALEPFIELFTDTTLYLGPYSEEDAKAMLNRLSSRKGVNHPPSFHRFLLRASGGHAGLLRASFGMASQISYNTPESVAFRFLLNSKPVQDECQTIWDSLSIEERLTIKEVLKRPSALGKDPQTVTLLLKKQLLKKKEEEDNAEKGDEEKLEVNPWLFSEYARQFAAVKDLPDQTT